MSILFSLYFLILLRKKKSFVAEALPIDSGAVLGYQFLHSSYKGKFLFKNQANKHFRSQKKWVGRLLD